MGLEKYRSKRDFSKTPEPEGGPVPAPARAPVFVVQKHAASQLHYDFRLEIAGALKSWAVPRGPSLDPADKRLAVEVEDHPLAYAGFEGVIPAGEYGGGTVLLWDRGHWLPEGDAEAALAAGKLRFRLAGEKLRGEWSLVRMGGKAGAKGAAGQRANWLLIKHPDEFARPDAELDITESRGDSVQSGRGLDEIAAGRPPRRAMSAAVGLAAALPDFVSPQLATLVEDSPREGLWLVETKLDGYRLLAQIDNGAVRLWTRNREDWSARLPRLVAELQRLPVRNAWLDGEAVALDRAGRASFSLLQRALARGDDGQQLRYYLFDLLFVDGSDLRGLPQLERKERLRELLAGTVQEALAGTGLGSAGERCLRYCGHGVGRLDDAFRAACLQGEEGLILKRADAAYHGGRGTDWLKLKCGHRQEFVVAGFSAPEGRREGFGALLAGYYTSVGTLAYAGRVGAGFDRATLASLGARLRAQVQASCPFADALPEAERADVHWVAPGLVIDVRYAGWNRSDRLRQARYLGLREDKPARDVVREWPLLPRRRESGA
ncbi:MAG: ligase [Moraxellaceae bacterium]|jgi:bifunctional non-homologous end joining protein LigD|nr:ligase [Moraxellaceae bacterium]